MLIFASTSPATALEILLATSFSTALAFPEAEGMMQQSRDTYFPQFENQGINPVGDNTNHRIPAQTIKQLAPNAIKGFSIPSQLFAKVRSDRYDKDNMFGIFVIKMKSKIKAKEKAKEITK